VRLFDQLFYEVRHAEVRDGAFPHMAALLYPVTAWLATGMWHDALVRKGSRFGVLAEGGGYEDYLVGVIVVISGNSRLMDELFIRLP
jgi:hypothetical protein